jgi:hypothetical protein
MCVGGGAVGRSTGWSRVRTRHVSRLLRPSKRSALQPNVTLRGIIVHSSLPPISAAPHFQPPVSMQDLPSPASAAAAAAADAEHEPVTGQPVTPKPTPKPDENPYAYEDPTYVWLCCAVPCCAVLCCRVCLCCPL